MRACLAEASGEGGACLAEANGEGGSLTYSQRDDS